MEGECHHKCSPNTNISNHQSDYCFSVTGALEGFHAIATNKLISLSEQNILDCSRDQPWNNKGYVDTMLPNKTYFSCEGGDTRASLLYVIENKGIDSEASYPYEDNVRNSCNFTKDNIATVITGN